jgi:hypothetical protein
LCNEEIFRHLTSQQESKRNRKLIFCLIWCFYVKNGLNWQLAFPAANCWKIKKSFWSLKSKFLFVVLFKIRGPINNTLIYAHLERYILSQHFSVFIASYISPFGVTHAARTEEEFVEFNGRTDGIKVGMSQRVSKNQEIYGYFNFTGYGRTGNTGTGW